MYSFLTCRRFLHNKEVDNTDIYLEIYIFRVDNYAGNASGEQSSSENCNQFSVLGSGIWTWNVYLLDKVYFNCFYIYRLECMICTHFIIKGLIPFQVFFFFSAGFKTLIVTICLLCVFFLSKLNWFFMYFNVWYVPANCICFFIFHMVCNGIYMVMGFDDTLFYHVVLNT